MHSIFKMSKSAPLYLLSAIAVLLLQAPVHAQEVSHPEYIEVAKNVRLHVTDVGKGRPVVLIHGFPLSDEMYEYQYEALAKAGFRAIGITMRGFGHSDKPGEGYNYDTYADDIKAVLDQLHVDNVVLGGFSMGGAIVIHYMSRHHGAHVSKLALFAAAAPCWTKPPSFFSKEDINGLIALNSANRPALYDAFGQKFTATSTSLPAGIGAWLGVINLQASGFAVEQMLITLREDDETENLKAVKVPTLILQGRNDHIVSYQMAEQLNKAIPNSKLVPFEKSGHALFVEEPDNFNKALIEFAGN
jgi:pimeloyl-ACP methyl ester carboxylesterase